MLSAWQPEELPGRIKDLQEFRDIKHSSILERDIRQIQAD